MFSFGEPIKKKLYRIIDNRGESCEEDFVQMRRQEQSYEEMIAEQMYLEELEMRRFQHMYQDEYDSQYYQDYDYGSYYGGRSKRGYKVKN
jgi:hypothetical protein